MYELNYNLLCIIPIYGDNLFLIAGTCASCFVLILELFSCIWYQKSHPSSCFFQCFQPLQFQWAWFCIVTAIIQIAESTSTQNKHTYPSQKNINQQKISALNFEAYVIAGLCMRRFAIIWQQPRYLLHKMSSFCKTWK